MVPPARSARHGACATMAGPLAAKVTLRMRCCTTLHRLAPAVRIPGDWRLQRPIESPAPCSLGSRHEKPAYRESAAKATTSARGSGERVLWILQRKQSPQWDRCLMTLHNLRYERRPFGRQKHRDKANIRNPMIETATCGDRAKLSLPTRGPQTYREPLSRQGLRRLHQRAATDCAGARYPRFPAADQWHQY